MAGFSLLIKLHGEAKIRCSCAVQFLEYFVYVWEHREKKIAGFSVWKSHKFIKSGKSVWSWKLENTENILWEERIFGENKRKEIDKGMKQRNKTSN